jgi:hypothetical protein
VWLDDVSACWATASGRNVFLRHRNGWRGCPHYMIGELLKRSARRCRKKLDFLTGNGSPYIRQPLTQRWGCIRFKKKKRDDFGGTPPGRRNEICTWRKVHSGGGCSPHSQAGHLRFRTGTAVRRQQPGDHLTCRCDDDRDARQEMAPHPLQTPTTPGTTDEHSARRAPIKSGAGAEPQASRCPVMNSQAGGRPDSRPVKPPTTTHNEPHTPIPPVALRRVGARIAPAKGADHGKRHCPE